MHVNAAFETLAQIRLFYAILNTKMILDFTVATFEKKKQFYCVKVSYELLDYNTSLTCLFTVVVFVQLSFMYKTALVSVAIL